MFENHIALEVSRDEHFKSPYLKSLRENWPSLAKDFRHYCHVAHPKVGEVWTWVSPEGQRFFHLILDEQEFQSTNSTERLQNFKKALKNMKKNISDMDLKSIELPRVGFHFNQAEIEIAQSLVKEVFYDSDIQVKFI